MDILSQVALVLILVGAVNWGFYGLFNLDLVKEVSNFFGTAGQMVATLVYVVVALSGLFILCRWQQGAIMLS